MPGSSIPDYPQELLWGNRQPDNNFSADEELYYRVQSFDERGKIGSVDVILCPDTSVNRGKYSKPGHVLYARLPQFLDWKVAKFLVREIPPSVTHPEDARVFQFSIQHDPRKKNPPAEPDENYAHCEIRAFFNQEHKKRVPGLVAKLYRQILADLMEQVPDDKLYA